MTVLFVWGGMVWGSYTIALAMMGDRFKTGQITLANATFIVVMEIANLAGPPIAGVAIDTADGQGLIGFFVLFSGVLFTVVALRGLRRGDLVPKARARTGAQNCRLTFMLSQKALAAARLGK